MTMKKITLAICLSLILSGFSVSLYAEVYKWVDENGVVHYSDVAPGSGEEDVETFYINPISIDEQGAVIPEEVAVQSAANKEQPFYEPYLSAFLELFSGDNKESGQSENSSVAEQKPAQNYNSGDAITNENMGSILAEIERDKQREKELAEKTQVEIFTTPWCGYCKKAIVWMEMNNVKYREYNVEANHTAALRQKMLGGGKGVPFAVVNGKKIKGWNQRAYAKALGI